MKKLYAASVIVLFLAACASLTSPNGGPKDIIPPELMESRPAHNEVNFKGKIVELTFDEAIQLKNPKEEIIITPPPGKDLQIKAKGSKVTIEPPQGWKDSTTYSLQFRDGVQDLTEGNSPINLKLAFSTGPLIDSLHITGRITQLLNGASLANITVAIYQQDTFDIFTDPPSYFTKSNKKGRFRMDNIKDGAYHIYAFEDKNKNLKVDSRNERYGFLADSMDLSDNIDSISIGLIQVDTRRLRLNSIRNAGVITRLRFNKSLLDYAVNSQSDVVHAFADTQEEIIFWNPPAGADSLQINLTASDSVGNKLDSSFFIKKTSTRYIPDAFKWSLGRPTIETETGKFSTVLSFSKPISNIDFDSLFIELDTLTKISIAKEDISINLPRKQINITKTLDKKLLTREKATVLNFQAGKGLLVTVDSDTSKRLSTRISLVTPEDVGVLLVSVSASKKPYLIQLVSSDGKLVASAPNIVNYTFRGLPPGEYQLRAVIDSNKNEKWDPGNFYEKREPEKVIFYKPPGPKATFPVRANWELGPINVRF